MTTADIESNAPWTVATCDPAWLTEALRASQGIDRRTAVTAVAIADLISAMSLSGQLFRLTPSYSGGTGPTSLVLKLPPKNAANRTVGDLLQLHLREAAFYSGPARRVLARVPSPYAVLADPATDSALLLLEDLAGWTEVDQLAGVDVSRAARVVDALAAVHAGEWERPIDPAEPPLPAFDSPTCLGLAQLYRSAWPGFRARWGHCAPVSGLEVGERLGDVFEATMLEATAQAPRTLLHGDCRVGNMLFEDRDPAPATSGPGAVALLDWQHAARGPAMSDLATFLGQSLTVPVRRACERDLIARWHGRMVERLGAAMNAYPLERAFVHYRRLLLYSTLFPVIVGGHMDLPNDYARALGEAITTRAFTALVDLDCAELLPRYETQYDWASAEARAADQGGLS